MDITRDPQIEKEFISRLVLNASLMSEAYGIVPIAALESEGTRELYSLMRSHYEKKSTWDVIILRDQIQDTDTRVEYLYNTPEVFSPKSFGTLCKLLREHYVRKQVWTEGHNLVVKSSQKNIDKVIKNSSDTLSKLLLQLKDEKGYTRQELFDKHKALMLQRLEGDVTGITTGIPTLDMNFNQGLERSSLYIIGARPSVGKTSFTLTLALNAATAKHNVLFISCEMHDQQILDRLVSFVSDVPLTTIVRGKIKPDQLQKAYDSLESIPLTLQYLSSASIESVKSLAIKHKEKFGLDLLVVDYLGMLTSRSDEEVQELGRIVKGLKDIAMSLQCAVVTPHQLNRRIEKRSGVGKETAVLSDLRDSGHIEQDADAVIFLTRKTAGKVASRAMLQIAKNRLGETGAVPLEFNPYTTRFYDVP